MFTQKGSFIMKKSRTFRKSFVAAIAALCLAAPLAVMPMTVSADTTYSITITATDSATTHKYVAYQIFSGDLSVEGTEKVLSDIEWGSDVNVEKITIQELCPVLGDNDLTEKTASKVAEKLTNNNSETFANYIEDCLKGSGSVLSADDTTDANDYKVTGLSAGYYLVKDEADLNNQTASKTSYILEVVSNISTSAKSAVPTIVKKVQENTELEDKDDYTSGSGNEYDDYNDVADYNIGDDVPFLDDGTLPSDFDSYDDYYYQIVDTPGDKFTPNITNEDGNLDMSKITVTIVDKGDNGEVVEKEVFVDGDNVKIEYVNSQTGTTDNPDTIKVTFENIRDIYEVDESGEKGDPITVDKDSHVTVEYTAKLDSDAEIGLPGQESKVKLNFSNDPNEYYDSTDDNDGEPDGIGTTPEDKVIVFTYELDVLKQLADSTEEDGYKNATNGEVGFKLYRMNDETKEYAIITNSKVSGWIATENNGTEVTTTDSKVIFLGLDDGTYWLKETKTPAGYNSIEDYKIVINATTENGQDWNEVADTALIEVDLKDKNDGYLDGEEDTDANTDGILDMTINNEKGSSLPSTGGIGTTIFYLGGGTMAAVAGVYLITKKRMKNEEDDEI